MIKIGKFINEEYVSEKCLIKDVLVACKDKHILKLEEDINDVKSGIDDILGTVVPDEEWIGIVGNLIYLITSGSRACTVLSIANKISNHIGNVSMHAFFAKTDFIESVKEYGLYKTFIVVSTEMLNHREYKGKDMNLLYPLAALSYTQHFVDLSWNSSRYVNDFANLDLNGFSCKQALEPTPFLLMILTVFDTPYKFDTILKCLGDCSNYFLELVSGCIKPFSKDCEIEPINLLSLLNDYLKEITEPEMVDLYDVVFNDKAGLTKGILEDVVTNAYSSVDYYYQLRRYFNYGIEEQDLRKVNNKSLSKVKSF